MSECLVTPTVVGVSALPVGLLVGGAVLTTLLVRKWISSMESPSRTAFEELVRAVPPLSAQTLLAPSRVEQQARAQLKALEARLDSLRLPPAAAVRLSGLVRLASSPYVVQKPALVEQRLSALLGAVTVEEAVAARRALLQTVRTEHRQAFIGAVAQACSDAARQIGFERVELSPGRRGELRVIAANNLGQALVTEIHPNGNHDPSLAAEVVGVRDGSCRQIMDAFEKALASQGVRYAPPRRRPTSGVCELEAAREFLRGGSRQSSGSPAADRRRALRLNRKQEVLLR